MCTTTNTGHMNMTKEDSVANISKHSIKRQHTSTSLGGNMDRGIIDENDYPFIKVQNRNGRKQQRIDNKDMEVVYISSDEIDGLYHDTSHVSTKHNGRLFINNKNKASNRTDENRCIPRRTYDISHQTQVNAERQSVSDEDDSSLKNRARTNDGSVSKPSNTNPQKINHNISQSAINYAIEQHLPPIHIGCTPKLKEHHEGKEIIKAFFNYIEKDFKEKNKYFNLPLGFDYWFINKNGDLTCHTKHTELFVYLCESEHYPTTLKSTNIIPNKPKHLPYHHTLLIKYVPNGISLDEIKIEIETSINSIFNLEEMVGSKTDRFRHLRLELKSNEEYERLLKRGGSTIDGRIIEVQEFLAPPRLLICSKCNDSGHVRKNCKLHYDICRRCGQDRSNGDHKDCPICCHRCKQDHLSTDYKCPYLTEYRKSLVH